MRENFRQNRSPECRHVAGFDVAFEKSKSRNHVVGLSRWMNGVIREDSYEMNVMRDV